MFVELDIAVLTRDIPEKRLKAGDLGTVVHAYASANLYEVEFVDALGATLALLTLDEADLRIMADKEILHVRLLDQAAA
ncbi:MAG: DUF4926 domain-containing protein [Deltaproteobacteria bacterium]|nr:DUF4926 domain-containing protein [Deltaproteobacteria bacterium]